MENNCAQCSNVIVKFKPFFPIRAFYTRRKRIWKTLRLSILIQGPMVWGLHHLWLFNKACLVCSWIKIWKWTVGILSNYLWVRTCSSLGEIVLRWLKSLAFLFPSSPSLNSLRQMDKKPCNRSILPAQRAVGTDLVSGWNQLQTAGCLSAECLGSTSAGFCLRYDPRSQTLLNVCLLSKKTKEKASLCRNV